jgi:hypothetical protein
MGFLLRTPNVANGALYAKRRSLVALCLGIALRWPGVPPVKRATRRSPAGFRANRRQTLPWDYFRVARQPTRIRDQRHQAAALNRASFRYQLFQAKDLKLLIASDIDLSVGHYRN